jgi:hypothetical protein
MPKMTIVVALLAAWISGIPQLDGFTDSLRALEDNLDDRTLAGMSSRGLTDLKSRWTRERDQLQGWDINLQSAT